MSYTTKVWLLSGLTVALAIGVVWQLIIRKDEFFPRPEVASAPPMRSRSPEKVTTTPRDGASGPGSNANGNSAVANPIPPQPLPKPNAGIESDAATPAPLRRKMGAKNNAAPVLAQPKGGSTDSLSPATPKEAPEMKRTDPVPVAKGQASPAVLVQNPAPVQPAPTQDANATELMMQNAQAALAKGNFIAPADNSALYWARRARQANPRNQAAIQIEETILSGTIDLIEKDRKAARYDNALRRLDMMRELYPNRQELTKLRSTILEEQSRKVAPPQ